MTKVPPFLRSLTMKKCPACGYVSADDDLYCPEDGTDLVAGSSPSVFETPTQFIPTPALAVTTAAEARSPMTYLAFGAMGATIAALAVAVYMMSGADKSNNNTNLNVVAVSSETPSNNTKASRVNAMAVTEKPPANVSRANADSGSHLPAYAPGAGDSGPPSSGTWFVVLGSYRREERGKADERLRLAQGRGISASIVDTDNYPGFRAGYYSVVMGPYSKDKAKNLLPGMKSLIPDAYVRSGW